MWTWALQFFIKVTGIVMALPLEHHHRVTAHGHFGWCWKSQRYFAPDGATTCLGKSSSRNCCKLRKTQNYAVTRLRMYSPQWLQRQDLLDFGTNCATCRDGFCPKIPNHTSVGVIFTLPHGLRPDQTRATKKSHRSQCDGHGLRSSMRTMISHIPSLGWFKLTRQWLIHWMVIHGIVGFTTSNHEGTAAKADREKRQETGLKIPDAIFPIDLGHEPVVVVGIVC